MVELGRVGFKKMQFDVTIVKKRERESEQFIVLRKENLKKNKITNSF